ncbi:MAG: hypothetical protein MJD61_17355, partial [Proteobacteria bacterium]|nr:hypothetical protein [Pseudomonadota bacterium]
MRLVWLVGVDENGLGPRLGPLVATAICAETRRYRRPSLCELGRRLGIHDSKLTSAFGKMRHTEGIVLALVERLSGALPRDADALLASVSLAGLAALRAPCPKHSAPQCWQTRLSLPAFGGDIGCGHAALQQLAKAGVRLRRARSLLACARVFNAESARLGSRFALDVSMFERLLVDAREASQADLEARCGMVGGIRGYVPYFTLLRPDDVQVLRQATGRVSYRVAGLGRVHFEVDADARHLLVALASMLGKYLRELAMERQNRFYARHGRHLAAVSGYHDPRTRRFIEQ